MFLRSSWKHSFSCEQTLGKKNESPFYLFFAWLHYKTLRNSHSSVSVSWGLLVGAFTSLSAGSLYHGTDNPADIDRAVPVGHIPSWVLAVVQAPIQYSQRDVQDVLFKLESKQAIYQRLIS